MRKLESEKEETVTNTSARLKPLIPSLQRKRKEEQTPTEW